MNPVSHGKSDRLFRLWPEPGHSFFCVGERERASFCPVPPYMEVKKMHNGQRGAECVPVGKGALNIGFAQRPEGNKRRRDRYDHI